jgi:hypothetical protein
MAPLAVVLEVILGLENNSNRLSSFFSVPNRHLVETRRSERGTSRLCQWHLSRHARANKQGHGWCAGCLSSSATV